MFFFQINLFLWYGSLYMHFIANYHFIELNALVLLWLQILNQKLAFTSKNNNALFTREF